MNRIRTTILALVAAVLGITALGAVVLSVLNGGAYAWLSFYVWKLGSGKAHGGQRVSINDASIYYETYGAGPPVLVLHGGFGTIEGMSYQIMKLAESHLVVAVDTRGHGRSTASSEPMSYALIADDMLKLLDRLQICQVDVVGWSDGGIVALDLAIRHPERVGRLVAISANFDTDGLVGNPAPASEVLEIPSAPLRYKLLAPDPTQWPVLYRNVVTMWRTQPHYTLEELSHIKAPALVMAGQFDVVKPEHTDQLAKSIPGGQEIIVQGSTHAVPREKPEIVNGHILRFLEERE
jgi:pimeloyl-ACP methyl ester carboxylesterase